MSDTQRSSEKMYVFYIAIDVLIETEAGTRLKCPFYSLYVIAHFPLACSDPSRLKWTRGATKRHREGRRSKEKERERVVEEWRLQTSAWRMVKLLMVTTKVLGATIPTKYDTRLPRRRCPPDDNNGNSAYP